MNLRLCLGTVLCGILLSFPGILKADHCDDYSYCKEYLVKFTKQATENQIDAVCDQYSLTIQEYFESAQIYHVHDSSSKTQEEALKILNEDAIISYAEPNYKIEVQALPNDPYFYEQWALQNTGQYQGVPGIDLGMDDVWDILVGSQSVIAAVLDSGVDYNHPDLKANMWVNKGEIPNNNKDDDGNGYVDDVYGYDFVSNDGDPQDDFYHGTHVAGTIGAVGNNGIGVTGVNWKVKLMALKFMGNDGKGSLTNAMRGIEYATRNGAKVINNSWIFSYPGLYSLPQNPYLEPVQSLRDAIVAADKAGMVFVAAAGNSAINSDTMPQYPASYSVPNVVSVTATDTKDNLANFSNYGPISVDLGAPGTVIFSTFPQWKINPPYKFMSGTSQAAPHVAGAAALLMAANPGWSHRQVIDQLLASVSPVSALKGKSVTGGRLDVSKAVGSFSYNQNYPPVANAGPTQYKKVGETVTLQGTATDQNGDAPLTFKWTMVSPIGSKTSLSSSYSSKVNFLADVTGTYTATLIVSDGKSSSLPSSVKIYVSNPISSTNNPPVASAGPNQLRKMGDTVLVIGKGSDAEGDPLTYQWSLKAPYGSYAKLNASNLATVSFKADLSGTYYATLVVSDGKKLSTPATAKIYVVASTSSTNQVPIANAGPNQLRKVGDKVLFIGNGMDANGDTLSYKWSFVPPAGSGAKLYNSLSSTAYFLADKAGVYLASLVVSDGKSFSAPSLAKVYVVSPTSGSIEDSSLSLVNEEFDEFEGIIPPNVVIEIQREEAISESIPAGGDQVELDEIIQLDGSASSTSDGQPLVYEWSLVEKPEDSAAEIDQADQMVVELIPDVTGRYTILLSVSNGKHTSQAERSILVTEEVQEFTLDESALLEKEEAQALDAATQAGTEDQQPEGLDAQTSGGCSLQVKR